MFSLTFDSFLALLSGQTKTQLLWNVLHLSQFKCRKCTFLLFLFLHREDCGWSLPQQSQTLWDTPLWQEAAAHQDQNLTPQEQFLPICYQPHQQGPESTLTPSLSPSRSTSYVNVASSDIQSLFVYIYIYRFCIYIYISLLSAPTAPSQIPCKCKPTWQ